MAREATKSLEKCKKSVAGEITVYTDHQNGSNFATKKKKSRPDGKRLGQSTYN
jgi:hypothetical protein